MQKFGRYFARKGWFGFDKTANTLADNGGRNESMTAEERIEGVKSEGWNVGESGRKILLEVATAYAITKVLLPARVVLSVWATPWFARHVLGGLRRMFGKGSKGGVNGVTVGASAGGARVVVKGTEKKIP